MLKNGKRLISALTLFLAAMLTVVIPGCSDGNNSQPAAEEQTELEALKQETERLRAELDAAHESANATEEKVDALAAEVDAIKSTLAASQEDHVASVKVEAAQTELAAPKISPEAALAGEWYYKEFYEDGIFSFQQSIVFYSDGRGIVSRTYYVPDDTQATSMEDIDSSSGLSWTLDGDQVHIKTDSGEEADFTFLPATQKLYLTINSDEAYGRNRPLDADGFILRALFSKNADAKMSAITRQFLGTWYFDLMTWTFNDDGTGVIDIPEIARQPASTRTFNYSILPDENGNMKHFLMTIDWDNSNTGYYWATIEADGSMTLSGIGGADPIRLTRMFDASNCPITQQILAQEFSVITGSIVYDVLPKEFLPQNSAN